MQIRAIGVITMLAACHEQLDELPEDLTVDGIQDVLSLCEAAGTVLPPPAGTGLELYTIPTSMFPDAVCNDGSPAVMFYRPGTDTSSWLIELEGGGTCRTAQECADRFCGQDGNFGHPQMSSDEYAAITNPDGTHGIVGTGIQSTTSGPFATYNHVLIHDCSSDVWSGIDPLQVGTAMSPWDRSTVTFTTAFNGYAILVAAIRVLRQDGATLPPFDLDGMPYSSMPDLDDASGEVIIAGGSAGGSGVERQLDRMVEHLTAKHNASLPLPFYGGLIDSAFPPTLEDLDFDLTDECGGAACDWQGFVEAMAPYFTTVTDDSCMAAHPTETFKCSDNTHVVRNHITTPFFLRQGELDTVLGPNYVDENLAVVPTPPATVQVISSAGFATAVRDQANTIPTWNTTAEEPLATLPGAFVPDCPKHDPLHDTAAMFLTTIDSYPWPFVWQNWRAGTIPSVVVSDSVPAHRVCR